MPEAELIEHVTGIPSESIYDDIGRLAQPDEVWNYGRGDGLEKAVMLATILSARTGAEMAVEIDAEKATLSHRNVEAAFPTTKGLPPQTWSWPLN